MNLRYKAFGIHFLASALIMTVVLTVLYIGWYAWPAWYLLGAAPIVAIFVAIGILAGPALTLFVTSNTKPRAVLRKDIAIIIALQVAALGFGTFTLWQGRPLFYTLTLDRIELVTAAEFDHLDLERAKQKGAQIMPSWSSLPQWIWAPLPSDQAERESIVESALTQGKDIISMPEYFRAWDTGLGDLNRQMHPLSELATLLKLDPAGYEKLEQSFKQTPDALGWLRMYGNKRGGVMIFERPSGKPIRFIALSY